MLLAIGSPAGLPALKAAMKTVPETVFVPAEPTSVTLTRRPETPRSWRSSADRLPTLVRASAAKIAESWAGVYVCVCQVA